MNEKEHKSGNYKVTGAAFSILLHALLLCGMLFVTGDIKPPEEDKIVSVSLMPAVFEQPQPEQPKPEQPQPEQPQPEQPQPEQPKPEQPQPEQPKPEPPKPEPPKPEQPKPKPKPEQPKPEQPKPKPKPSTPTLEERLKNAPRQKNTNTRTTRNNQNVRQILENATRNSSSSSTTSANRTNASAAAATRRAEVENYAEQVVKPYILSHWIQPVSGELEVAMVAPVRIGFTVYSGGSVQNARIVKPSNSRVMNESVKAMLSGMNRLPALSSIGIKSASLEITVDVCLTK